MIYPEVEYPNPTKIRCKSSFSRQAKTWDAWFRMTIKQFLEYYSINRIRVYSRYSKVVAHYVTYLVQIVITITRIFYLDFPISCTSLKLWNKVNDAKHGTRLNRLLYNCLMVIWNKCSIDNALMSKLLA